jgi:hypothetical protein
MSQPDAIVSAFEDTTLPADRFHHREHLLVAWTYLGALPFADAAARFATNLRRYAAAKGVADKYHETITWALLAILGERRCASPQGEGFDAFIDRNPDLLDARGALAPYYDEATLASEHARAVFVLPKGVRA